MFFFYFSDRAGLLQRLTTPISQSSLDSPDVPPNSYITVENSGDEDDKGVKVKEEMSMEPCQDNDVDTKSLQSEPDNVKQG